MSEPFAGDLGMYAARQQMRCVGVAQVVIANARQARLTYLANPFMGEAVRLDGPAIRLRHDESVVRDADAKAEKTLRLVQPGVRAARQSPSPTWLRSGTCRTWAAYSECPPWSARQSALPQFVGAPDRHASIAGPLSRRAAGRKGPPARSG